MTFWVCVGRRVGVGRLITIDGTKIKANASMDQNRSYSGLVRARSKDLVEHTFTIPLDIASAPG